MRNAVRMPVPIAIGLGIWFGWWMAGGPYPLKPAAFGAEQAAAENLDRTVLPIPEPSYPPITELDVRNAKAPPRFEVKAPAGAPNVLIVLIDDMGFGQSSAFGGPIHMPTAERLARQRAAVQSVPHDGALLADPCRAALRPQPSRVQHGLDHGDRHRVPRADRAAAQQRGAAGRDAPPQRLRHRRLRQVARDRGLGGQHFGPDQSLADPLRLRQVLRVHRRRGQSVGAGDLRRDEPGRAAQGCRTTTS